jgi:uncharacterized protein (DUF433 family)
MCEVFKDLFSQDPMLVGGRMVFKGTRVLVETVIASLAEGDTHEQILKSFPSLTMEHLLAAERYANLQAK